MKIVINSHMRHIIFLIVLSFAFGLSACVSTSLAASSGSAEHPEARLYIEGTDARSEVDAALAAAKASGKNAIIVMGANWCHDSRALAGWFETPRFAELLSEYYIVQYVDVGMKDTNLDIARSFGLDGIVGTPTIVIISPEGSVLNLDTAPTWRNAASRSEDEIFAYFDSYKAAH